MFWCSRTSEPPDFLQLRGYVKRVVGKQAASGCNRRGCPGARKAERASAAARPLGHCRLPAAYLEAVTAVDRLDVKDLTTCEP
jgi:hypothetical protein